MTKFEHLIREIIQETMGNRFDVLEGKVDSLLTNHLPHLDTKITDIKIDQAGIKIDQAGMKADIRWIKWLVCSILCGGACSVIVAVILRVLFG